MLVSNITLCILKYNGFFILIKNISNVCFIYKICYALLVFCEPVNNNKKKHKQQVHKLQKQLIKISCSGSFLSYHFLHCLFCLQSGTQNLLSLTLSRFVWTLDPVHYPKYLTLNHILGNIIIIREFLLPSRSFLKPGSSFLLFCCHLSRAL